MLVGHRSWRDVHGDVAWFMKAGLVILAGLMVFMGWMKVTSDSLQSEASKKVLNSYAVLAKGEDQWEILLKDLDGEVITEMRKQDAELGRVKSFKFRASDADVSFRAVSVRLDVTRERGKTIEEVSFRYGRGTTFVRVYPRAKP